jgi:galactokinase
VRDRARGETGGGTRDRMQGRPALASDGVSDVRPRIAFAPGRVNLIGDHTDYMGGFVLPMAIQLGTTVTLRAGGDRVRLTSNEEAEPADIPITVTDPASATPHWARYVAGVTAEVRPVRGGAGCVTTTLPVGAGLASSAALEVALALALGFAGEPLQLARSCQRAEQRASGVPCGLMDQLAAAAGIDGHALLIDCCSDRIEPVAIPPECEIVAVHSGQARSLSGSAYTARRSACEAAADIVGPLRHARLDDLSAIDDSVVRGRARHVITENSRVLAFVAALRAGDLNAAGALMVESHASLRDDFDVSTPALDDLVARIDRQPGVFGCRLTGAGFGGCVVALTEPGALEQGWRLRAFGPARLLSPGRTQGRTS